jgi:xylan 1,4-beta-xylosidase
MNRNLGGALLLCCLSVSCAPGSTAGQEGGAIGPPAPIAIRVDLSRTVGPMSPIWAWIGYDEPNYTYQADGRRLLTDLAELSPVPVYVRAHNLLTTHEGNPVALKWGSTNAYTEDEDGTPVYDWTTMDRIVDTWVERGMKPLMEIGFMPKALSTNPEPYRHDWRPGQPYSDVYTGWAYPPADYEKWAELVYQWVRHSVDRYGQEEVESWWWQAWNEPNIAYWQGTREEFFKLHDYTADAVKRALPTARIGGPNTAGTASRPATAFLTEFLEHCRSGTNYATGEVGSPLDFLGFHAKGSPSVTDDGHVRMGMGNQLLQIERGFEILASFPEFRDLPVILGENDPEGCAACPSSVAAYRHNDYRNGTMFSSYTASSFAKIYELIDAHGSNFHGAVHWTFTFPNEPYFSGFRSFSTTDGINKPVLNVLRMFGMMGGDRVRVERPVTGYSASRVIAEGVRADPEVDALASRDDNQAAVMVWQYHDDDRPFPSSRVQVAIENVPAARALLHHYRIDDRHSNAYRAWLEMGAPQQMSRAQIQQLQKEAELALYTSPAWIRAVDGVATVQFDIPHQGVSLLQLTW